MAEENNVTAQPSPEGGSAGKHKKADLIKRFLALFIDGLLAGLVTIILSIALPIVGTFLGLLAGAAYFLVRDGLSVDFMDGRSLGKKVMKLRPVKLDGSAMTVNDSVRRNWVFALPTAVQIIPILGTVLGGVAGLILGVLECILVLSDGEGRRWGDKLAETMVIEVEE